MKYLLLILLLLPACHPQKTVATPTIQTTTKIDATTSEEPDVSFTTPHSLSENDARTAAESLARSLQKYGLKWSWQNNVINFETTSGTLNGTHGTLTLHHPHITINLYHIPKLIPNTLIKHQVNGKIQTYFKID